MHLIFKLKAVQFWFILNTDADAYENNTKGFSTTIDFDDPILTLSS